MKIIYMGTPEFAVPPLEAILAAGHQVRAVATQPDRQKGRGREVKCSPVKEYAARQGLPVWQPDRIRTDEAVTELKRYNADICVVAAYGRILSEEILDLTPYGCINIHASLLPRYRGAAPIQRAIIGGEKETGVTIMRMDKGIDTGDILLAAAIPIAAKETGDSLTDKLSLLGARLVTEALAKIEKGDITGIKQNDAASSYAPPLSRLEGRIDWKMPADALERLVRGLNSRPGAYTYCNKKILKIWAADADPARSESAVTPGTVVGTNKNGLVVACGEGCLTVTELQLEGKKKMPAGDFLRGLSEKIGLLV